MKTAAIYVRVSTERQKEELTIDSQIEELERYAIENGYTVIERYKDDGWSGDILARPDLDRMRDDSTKKIWETLLATDRDRLARRYSYQELIIDELIEAGINIQILHQATAITPEDRILQGVQGLFAEYERVKIAERFRRGKMHKVRLGIILGNKPPYGYNYIRKTDSKQGYYEINPNEAEVVKKIFRWVGEEGLTVKKVVLRLEELKILPRMHKRGVWSCSPVSRMLHDETYIGTTYYNKTTGVVPKNPRLHERYKKIKKSSRALKPREDWVPIKVLSIISPELFAKAQKQITINARFSFRNRKGEYLLSGLVWCGCGRKRAGEGSVREHLYYRCTDRIYSFPMPKQCKASGVNAKVLDKMVWERTYNLLTNAELSRKQAERWLVKEAANDSKLVLEELPQLNKELARLDQEESRYVQAFGEGLINLDQFKTQISSVKDRKEELKVRIANVTKASEQKQKAQFTVERLVQAVPKVLESMNFQEKQELLRRTLDKVIVEGGQMVTVLGYIPVESEVNQNVGLEFISRNSRTAQCRQIDFI